MTYPIAGYNPYMNYGYYPLNNKKKGGMLFTSQPDTVTLSTNNQAKEQKTGLSKNAKLGLGALAIVGIGVAAYILSRGKVGNKSVQQLVEHIEFKPAKTLEEAKAYAKEKFGTKLELDNLELANWINEGITNVSNKMKGKSALPKKVTYFDEIKPAMMGWRESDKTLGVYRFYSDAMLRGAKNKNICLKEQLADLRKNETPLSTIYHEFGYINHATRSKFNYRVGNDKDIIKEFRSKVVGNSVIEDFFRPYYGNFSYQNEKTAYAFQDPLEYVAEVFRLKMEGKQIPEEVERIYKEYGGPQI